MVCLLCHSAVVFEKEDYIKIVLQSGIKVWYHGECFWQRLREKLTNPEQNVLLTLTEER